jgi:hypothetical protein
MKKSIKSFTKKNENHSLTINQLNILPNITIRTPGTIKSNIIDIVNSSVISLLVKKRVKIGIQKFVIR